MMILCGCQSAEPESGDPPNIVFIFPDQWRLQALGFQQADPVLTPNLDRLAGEGAVVTHALSNHPMCSPYRGMLMTGKTPLNNRIRRNCWPDDVYKYRNTWEKTDTSISDILTQHGYDAGYIGKLHLIAADSLAKASGWTDYAKPDEKHGFSFWYVQSKRENGQFTNFYYVNDAPADKLKRVDEWASTHEADMVIEYLHNRNGKYRDSSKPFALFWAPLPPHGPMSVPEEYLEIYKDKSREELLTRENVNLDTAFESGIDANRKYRDNTRMLSESTVHKYYAMVNAVDHEIGRVMAALKEAGLEDNTILVFTSDHGEMLGSHGMIGKYVWMDESMRIPFIIRWPEKIPAGVSRNMILNAYDLMPTLLGMVGLEDYIPADLDGMDCSEKIIHDRGPSPDFGYYMQVGGDPAAGGRRGLRTLTHTYIISFSNISRAKIKKYLYDNITDPMQMNNLAGTGLEVEQELEKMLLEALDEDRDPFSNTYRKLMSD